MLLFVETNIIWSQMDRLMIISLSIRLCRVPHHSCCWLYNQHCGLTFTRSSQNHKNPKQAAVTVSSVAFLTLKCHKVGLWVHFLTQNLHCLSFSTPFMLKFTLCLFLWIPPTFGWIYENTAFLLSHQMSSMLIINSLIRKSFIELLNQVMRLKRTNRAVQRPRNTLLSRKTLLLIGKQQIHHKGRLTIFNDLAIFLNSFYICNVLMCGGN